MTVAHFKQLLTRQPFEPFRVVMSSGETYAIDHPERAFLTRTTLYIGTDFDSQGIPEDSAMCSLLHVTSIEPLATRRRRRSR